MKLKFTLSIFGLFFAMFVLMSHSGGRAAQENEGNTGAPGDDSKTCATCHMGGSFGASISIEVFNDLGEVITEYIPGTVYTVQATVNTTSAPSGYGLQLVSLINSTNTDTNGLANPSSNAQLATLGNGRTYLEQNSLSSTSLFTADWTAPEVASGSVTFYAAGHAANGNNAAGGDQAALASLEISETISAIDEVANLGLKINPNPAVDFTQITLENNIEGTLELFDITGKLMLKNAFFSDQYLLDLSTLNQGMYFVKITDLENNIFETRRVIKK